LIVDVSVLYREDAGTGIQRVTSNVWRQLHDLCGGTFEIAPVAAEMDGAFYEVEREFLELPRDRAPRARKAFVARRGDIFLALDFSPILLPRCQSIVRHWKTLDIAIHLVVYDLLPLTNSDWFTWRGARNYRRWFSFLSTYADSALCISSVVADDLRQALFQRGAGWSDPCRIGKFRLGAQFLSEGTPVEPAGLPNLTGRPIILMVGTVEPRKAYDFALDVFDRLQIETGAKPVMIIVGKAGWKTRNLQARIEGHPLAGHALFWLKNLDDRRLAWLYANSAVLLSTSLAEGFGLPLVEARSYGLPVVATNLLVFHEFADEAVTFFEKGDVRQAAALLSHACQDGEMVERAPYARLATWQDAAHDILRHIDLDRPLPLERSGFHQ
jgi:glycosyltransferase involved in cell wall biosynthesis